MTGPELHDVHLVSPAGWWLLAISDRGEVGQFVIDGDGSVTVPARYDEPTDWTIRSPGLMALTEAIDAYNNHGNDQALSDLASPP